jgi:hypothetical protein
MFLWLVAASETAARPAVREPRKTPAIPVTSKTLPPNYASQPPRNYAAKLMARE